MGLGAIWSDFFYYGVYRHWLSQRLTQVLLCGTIAFALIYAEIVGLALYLPFVAVVEK